MDFYGVRLMSTELEELLGRVVILEVELNRALVRLGLAPDRRRPATREEGRAVLVAGIVRAGELAGGEEAPTLGRIANGASQAVMQAVPAGVIPASAPMEVANYLHRLIRGAWMAPPDRLSSLQSVQALLADTEMLLTNAPLPEV